MILAKLEALELLGGEHCLLLPLDILDAHIENLEELCITEVNWDPPVGMQIFTSGNIAHFNNELFKSC